MATIMTAHTNQPSVSCLEQYIAAKQHEQACAELLNILYKLDSNFGNVNQIEFDFPTQLTDLESERYVYFCTRMADAISRLFTQTDLIISESGFMRFMIVQRWIA